MLEHHLQELLYQKECIVIPGFGAIIANHTSARINETNHRIAPPSKTLAFNESLQTNDGMIANHLVSHENMNYAQALNLVRQEVKNWHQQLNDGKKLYLKNIGHFRKNENGKLIFRPSKDRNYLTEAYGFEATFLKPLEAPMESQPVVSSNQTKKLKRTHKPKIPTVMAAAGLAFAIAITSLVMYKNPAPNTVQGSMNIMMHDSPQTSKEEKSATKASSNQSLKIAKDTLEEASKGNGNNEKTKASQHQKANHRYFVITGSFRQQRNAQEYSKKWASKGYKPKIMMNKEGWHRVGVELHKDSIQAANALKRVRQQQKSDAWLLQTKAE